MGLSTAERQLLIGEGMWADVVDIQAPHVLPEVTKQKVEDVSHVGAKNFCHLSIALLPSNVHDELTIEHRDA